MLPRPVAFALGGGAAYGAVHVGMLRALREAGIEPDLVVIGLSSGAALLANALSAQLAPVQAEPGRPPVKTAPADSIILEGEIIDSDRR